MSYKTLLCNKGKTTTIKTATSQTPTIAVPKLGKWGGGVGGGITGVTHR